MIYQFACYECGIGVVRNSRPFHPPPPPQCLSCGELMARVFGCHIDTSGCKDHDDIPEEHRVQRSQAPRSAASEETAFQRHIQERRSLLRHGGGNRGSIRQTHSVPADLYHGKIRQTGDRDYWKDPKNLARHPSTRIDK